MRRIRVAFINHLLVSCLGWLVVLMLVVYASNRLYCAGAPDQPAYDIAAVDLSAQARPHQTLQAQADDALADLLRKGDVKRGEKIFSRCALCHTASQNGPDRIGPNLWHIVGRPVASARGFHYSRAMQAFSRPGRIWDFAALNAFLAAPARAVPGTLMSFAGIEDDQERADVLLYLNTLSDKPMALPDLAGP